MEVVKG
jgi:hypothetical protein